MKTLALALSFLSLWAFPAWAQNAPEQKESPESSEEISGPREQIIENLLSFSGESEEQLEQLIQEARRLKAPEQTLREARLLFYLSRGDEAGLALLAAEYAQTGELFKESDSQLFTQRNDWLGMIEFLQAVRARRAGDEARFEKGIKEAFWLSPAHSSAFAPFLERHHKRKALALVQIQPTLSLKSVNQKTESFAQWKKDKKALVFHFWSPWSLDCEKSLHDFLLTKRALAEHDIAVISVIVQPTAQLKKETPAFLRRYNLSPDEQFYDNKEPSLVNLLHIQMLPAMTLITPTGKVLFSGSPDEPEFWEQLQEISPQIKRPSNLTDSPLSAPPSAPPLP